MKHKLVTYRCKLARASTLLVARDPDAPLEQPEEVASLAMRHIGDVPHEILLALYVNANLQLIGCVEVGKGGLSGAAITPRDVLVPGLLLAARGFFLVHNHPSGNPQPSAADYDLTEAVSKAGKIVGMELLDHIVVCPRQNKWRSVQ